MAPSTVVRVKVKPVSAPEGAAGRRIWIQMEKQQGDLVTASVEVWKKEGKLQTRSEGSICHMYVEKCLNLTCLLLRLLTCLLTHLLTRLLTCFLTHMLTCLLTCLLTHMLTCLLTCLLTGLLTRLLTCLLTLLSFPVLWSQTVSFQLSSIRVSAVSCVLFKLQELSPDRQAIIRSLFFLNKIAVNPLSLSGVGAVHLGSDLDTMGLIP